MYDRLLKENDFSFDQYGIAENFEKILKKQKFKNFGFIFPIVGYNFLVHC